ncbi:Binding-protein-dependent transport systems inner membrane component [Rhodopseudomonas palustris HaA2]|uniref:Binding-protein-dependent transport systems inner membrane component n=1 Tax=Rhodopseudomonas palustris (strain HaA2) TaxID=316058 RepID=Q2IVG3_RHOP2|nr:ABC transporter permease [Rhodopseudomonas palustris]ABD07797.1 Binding-protein-dependent transport systems inner membrane component [Rhodopseudomonas palustris HaA2]
MKSSRKTSHLLQSLLLAVLFVSVWEGCCRLFGISQLVLPPPSAIAVRLQSLVFGGTIWPHLWATLFEILSGFVLGVLAGLVVGALISLIPVLERLIYPYLVALQTLPKVAIAPLFIIWFGYGLTSKVVITALVCFFPVLVSVIAGFHSTDKDQLDMMKAFGATKWQTLVRLRIPSALVLIFAGLEIAAVLAVIGAIVGEFVGAQVGLGYLVVTLNFSLDVAGVFAVLIVLSAIGLAMHAITRYAARRYIFWIRRSDAPVIP